MPRDLVELCVVAMSHGHLDVIVYSMVVTHAFCLLVVHALYLCFLMCCESVSLTHGRLAMYHNISQRQAKDK